MKANLLYVQTLAPLHSGVGQASDIVDLPVARERATAWPIVPGSGFKGALRSLGAEQADKMFGTQEAGGAIAVSDLRILLLPIRSFFGAMAWVTSPLALRRFRRDAEALGLSVDVPEFAVADGSSEVAPESQVAGFLKGVRKLVLEDFDLDAEDDPAVSNLAKALGQTLAIEDLATRLAVVSDTMFSFLCESALEVSARVRLKEDLKTVADGALWYEEAVPAETVFYGFAVAVRSEDDAANFRSFIEKHPALFLGGNTTVGMGLCQIKVAP